ncbi:MAG: 4-hydroxythreonine-4-phosphate dehydrogenase PdxA [Deltaproteobacteria bacterium]|nr:4-hydroxythreonine-4-phosphate dehydrogenase PdxA [Deltaproteobacteria bacterium]
MNNPYFILKPLPCIGITMGDPAGIGPEIIAMALADRQVYEVCRPVVLGDSAVLSAAVSRIGQNAPERLPDAVFINRISAPAEAQGKPGVIDLIPLSDLGSEAIEPGKPVVAGGKAMVDYILRAVDMAVQGEIQGMVTAPISKVLMHEAGYKYDGHTQLIAQRTNAKDYVMMLAGAKLRVVLVTIHCALKTVPDLLDREGIYQTIMITAQALKADLGFSSPRLAVAALNPHAGEEGLFGTEEQEMITPAISQARQQGIDVEGPFPADTLFHQAAAGRFEAVVAMYHDQGLIPLKLLHFSDAVNVTLGLPIIRTSVDHGTAYDIAGTGRADPSSLKAAIVMATEMAKNRGLNP